MPLSEHEQRLLEEMEKQLHADPQFAQSLDRAASTGRYTTRNIALGILIAVVGLGVVITGIALASMGFLGIAVGVLGFLMMCFGVYLALTKTSAPKSPDTASTRPGSSQKSGYMSRLEQQWEERQRRDGR